MFKGVKDIMKLAHSIGMIENHTHTINNFERNSLYAHYIINLVL